LNHDHTLLQLPNTTTAIMATTDGLPPDPLALLRSSIADSTLPIPTATADATTAEQSLAAAGYLAFNQNGQHVYIPLSQDTRFISVASGNKPIDLRSVFFCWQNRDKGTGEYIAATQELNGELSSLGKQETVTNLVFVEKLDLVNWLSGESGEEESEFIKSLDDNLQTKAEARDAAVTAAGGEDVEMRDAGISDAAARKREEERLREIYALERKMGDRNTVLRGVKLQDFSGIRKHSAAFHVKNAKGAPAPNAPLSTNPALRPSVKSSSGRRAEPIILLSPSASSLIRMPNVKSFLQDGQYQAPETASSTAPNILHLTRLLPSIDNQRPMRFILVDSPDQFRPDYWNRVVAVFTTGQAWQFKNYKWQAPADLFSHVLGVYVGWKGEVTPDTVKGWGRGVLSVGLDKGNARWRDREVVEEVWSGIETRMRAMGWSRDGPR
jgi:parafibromin